MLGTRKELVLFNITIFVIHIFPECFIILKYCGIYSSKMRQSRSEPVSDMGLGSILGPFIWLGLKQIIIFFCKKYTTKTTIASLN